MISLEINNILICDNENHYHYYIFTYLKKQYINFVNKVFDPLCVEL